MTQALAKGVIIPCYVTPNNGSKYTTQNNLRVKSVPYAFLKHYLDRILLERGN